MRYWMSFFSFALCLALVSGCEWQSSGDDQSWDDSFSWVDFSGTYRAPSGGALVTGFNTTPGSDPSETGVSGEILGTGNVDVDFYSGAVNSTPVKEGSVVIVVGPFTLTDNGDGTLSGTAGSTGTFSYETGTWSVDLVGGVVADGELIKGSYIYTSGGTDGSVDEGNTGASINTMVITQTGNKLLFRDNRGATYSGRLTLAETPGGDSTGNSAGVVTAAFDVSGTSSSGAAVQIIGTFSGDYTPGAAAESLTGGAAGAATAADTTDRTMNGTWLESTIQGDILGVTI